MKLFIWKTNFCRDWTSGMAVAIAENADQARRLIAEKHGGLSINPDDYDDRGLLAEPDEIAELDRPFASFISGGA